MSDAAVVIIVFINIHAEGVMEDRNEPVTYSETESRDAADRRELGPSCTLRQPPGSCHAALASPEA